MSPVLASTASPRAPNLRVCECVCVSEREREREKKVCVKERVGVRESFERESVCERGKNVASFGVDCQSACPEPASARECV